MDQRSIKTEARCSTFVTGVLMLSERFSALAANTYLKSDLHRVGASSFFSIFTRIGAGYQVGSGLTGYPPPLSNQSSFEQLAERYGLYAKKI